MATPVDSRSARTTRPEGLRGLKAIAELRRLTRRVLVFDGPRPLRTSDGIDVLPFAAFTRALADGTLWP